MDRQLTFGGDLDLAVRRMFELERQHAEAAAALRSFAFPWEGGDPRSLLDASLERLGFGGYRVTELVGKGGQGQVWRASREGSPDVAVKLFGDCLQAAREAVVMRDTRSPFVAGFYAAELPILVRELVEGPTIEQARKLGPIDEHRLLLELAKATKAIQDAGFVPADISDKNVVLSERGVVVIDVGCCGLGQVPPASWWTTPHGVSNALFHLRPRGQSREVVQRIVDTPFVDREELHAVLRREQKQRIAAESADLINDVMRATAVL